MSAVDEYRKSAEFMRRDQRTDWYTVYNILTDADAAIASLESEKKVYLQLADNLAARIEQAEAALEAMKKKHEWMMDEVRADGCYFPKDSLEHRWAESEKP